MSIHYSFYVEDAALLDRLAQEQGLAEDLGPAGAVSLDVRIDAHGENPPTTIVLTLAKRAEPIAPVGHSPSSVLATLLSAMDEAREAIRRETGMGSVPAGVRMHVVEPPNAIDTPMADITLHLQHASSRLSVVASEGRLVPWLKGRLEEARSDIANAMEVAERSVAKSRQLQMDNNALRQQVETLKAAVGGSRKRRNHGDHTCEEWEKATSERITMLNTLNVNLMQARDELQEQSDGRMEDVMLNFERAAKLEKERNELKLTVEGHTRQINSLKRQLEDGNRECSERVTAAISRETAAQTERSVDLGVPGSDFTVQGFRRYYPAVELVDSTCDRDLGVRGVMKEAAAGEWFARDEVVARVQEWAKIMGHMAAVNSKLLSATRINGLDNLMWASDKPAAKVNDAWESAQGGPLLRDEDRGMVTFSHLTAKEVEHLPVREWHAWQRRLTIHIEVTPTSEGGLLTPYVSTALRRYVRAIDGGATGKNARERMAFDYEGKQVTLVALAPVQP